MIKRIYKTIFGLSYKRYSCQFCNKEYKTSFGVVYHQNRCKKNFLIPVPATQPGDMIVVMVDKSPEDIKLPEGWENGVKTV